MLYDNNKFTFYDHHEQSTDLPQPIDPHTPGSQPPRMDSQVELSDAIQDELAADDHFHALYDDLDARNDCGCGPKEHQNDGCGCGGSRENDGK